MSDCTAAERLWRDGVRRSLHQLLTDGVDGCHMQLEKVVSVNPC